ncbi:MAG TPA: UDP-glucose 4-epimerase GalE [Acidobacteria bacterium]|nr:UDP-glucose 4-epimerase GalE [Acidobacteriota bacterium]
MVLVTGGAGYVGSHAVKSLDEAGHTPVVLDNLSAGHRGAVKGAAFIEGDVRNTDAVRSALREHRVTAVMHFAGVLSVEESVQHPARYYDLNLGGSLSLLEAMRAEGVRRLVFSSTCAVYGDPVTTPIEENHPTRPINAYGETKLAVERALAHYSRAYGVQSIALRYFNAAGADSSGELGEAHEPELHLIPLVIRAAQSSAPVQVFGVNYPTEDGSCERDYVHVTDLADAHVRALGALEGFGEELVSRIYNLGTGKPHSVRGVIAAVERVTGRRVRVVEGSRREGDPAVLCASAERVAIDLGWRPRYIDLDEVVATAWAWHKKHPGGFDD